MKRLLPGILALAACSASDGPAATATAAATPTPSDSPSPTAPAAAAAPRPGELKTFSDWTVACDNVKRCAMASLGPEEGAGDWPEWTMEAAREAGPGGGWALSLASQQDAPATPAAALVDGRRYPFAGDSLAGEGAARLVAALPNARALSIVDARGKVLARLSPTGLSASLRYIDAQQGRADTVTAVVAKGAKPAAAVPPAPAAPRVPALAMTKAAAPTAAQMAQMNKVAECEMPEGASVEPEAVAANGTTLVLLPCSAGAYNVIGALFTIKDGRVAPAETDAPAGFEETGADSQTPVKSVVNGTFDGNRLTSYAKGRGLGDCGVSQSFAWDGTRYRLVEQTAMGECRGNPNYVRTFTARAVDP